LSRGQCTNGDGWMVGYLTPSYYGDMYITDPDGKPNKRVMHVKAHTIGQCTGIKDKRGKLIFEGDIMQHTTQDGEKCDPYKVSWIRNGWMIDFGYDAEYADHIHDDEIIGNTHDNPELLEVSADE